MADKEKNRLLENLPVCVTEYIKLVIKKMRYRKKARAEVMTELAAHFEDELRDYKTDEEKEQKAQRLIENFGDPKLLAVLMRRAKNRCRPLWRTIVARIFQALAILILCLILYIAWFVSGKPSFTINYVDKLNRMVRPAVDESLNAAPLYEKAAKQYHKNLQDCNAIVQLQGKKFYELTPDQKQTVEKWLTDNKEILDMVITGSEKPYYWQTYTNDREELLSIYMPQLRDYRYLAYALRWRAQSNAERGNFKDAFDDIKTSYRIGRHITADKVTYAEQLAGREIKAMSVGTIRDILGHNRIDSATLVDLQNDFERLIASDDFTVNIETEKLTVYEVAQRCFTDDRIGGGHLNLKLAIALVMCEQNSEPNTSSLQILPSLLHILFTHPNKQQTIEMADRYYAFFESAAHKTPAQIKAEGIDIDKQVLKIVKGNILLEGCGAEIHKTLLMGYRNKVDVESTLPLIAILRYKQDFGEFPENLDKLVETGYLKKIPIDPFSDNPIVYKKTKDSFIIYSVGSNFVDDGGQADKHGDGKIKPFSDKGDWVFWPVIE
jgi:hypothetical protein